METKTILIIAGVVIVGGIAVSMYNTQQQQALMAQQRMMGMNNTNNQPWWQSALSGLVSGVVIGARTPVPDSIDQSRFHTQGVTQEEQNAAIQQKQNSYNGVEHPAGWTLGADM